MRMKINSVDDVLSAATKIAPRAKTSSGNIVSEPANNGLKASDGLAACQSGAVYGFRPFPKAGRIVSNDLINQLRDGGEY